MKVFMLSVAAVLLLAGCQPQQQQQQPQQPQPRHLIVYQTLKHDEEVAIKVPPLEERIAQKITNTPHPGEAKSTGVQAVLNGRVETIYIRDDCSLVPNNPRVFLEDTHPYYGCILGRSAYVRAGLFALNGGEVKNGVYRIDSEGEVILLSVGTWDCNIKVSDPKTGRLEYLRDGALFLSDAVCIVRATQSSDKATILYPPEGEVWKRVR